MSLLLFKFSLVILLHFAVITAGLKCMQPSDARYITTAYDIPSSWINTGWHTGQYLSTQHNTVLPEEHEDDSHRRGVIFSVNGTRIWWLENRNNNAEFMITEDQTKILCAHTVGGLRIDWFENTESNRDEDWCQWNIEMHPHDVTMFRMKNHVFIESMPEMGYVYFDRTGIYFDYEENSRNDVRNVIDDARKWWIWVKSDSQQREISAIEDQCTLGPSGIPDFLEPSVGGDDVIMARSAGRRRSSNYFVSSNSMATCSPGWFLFENKCYRIFRSMLMTQSRAKRICGFFNGILLIPKNQGEQTYVIRLLRRFDKNGRYWMGMEAQETGRRFYDENGDRLIFRRWGQRKSRFPTDRCSYWHNRRWFSSDCMAQNKMICVKEAAVKNTFSCGKIQDTGIDDMMRSVGRRRDRIVNGAPAEEGQFPWQVSIRFKTPVRFEGVDVIHNCGGTLIDECWVISAAHCFPERDPSIFTLRFGDLNNEVTEGTEQEFEIEQLFIHEEYSMFPSPRFDIALLKVARRNGRCVQFDRVVQPACLPDSSFPISDEGDLCQVSGWGVTNTSLGQSSSAANLQWVTLPHLLDSYCKTKYNRRSELYIDEIMMCAGLKTGGQDACTGDSGGPYVCRNEAGKYALVGIVSFGIGCARRSYPGVYTNVKHFLPWVSAKISSNGGGNIIAS